MMQDEMGLNLLDYGARFYDAVLGRWHSVDPLVEKFISLNPYCNVGNNPITRIDPDGRYWDEEDDKDKVKNVMTNLNERDASLARSENRANKQIEKIEKDSKMSESKRAQKLDELNKKLENLGAAREEILMAKAELTMMANDEKTAFAFNTLGYEATEGFVSHDKNSNRDTRVTLNYIGGSEGNVLHELKHGFQAMLGILIPIGSGGDQWFRKSGLLVEVSAYQREYSVDGSLPKSIVGKINSIDEITRDWVKGIYNYDNSGKIYFPYAKLR